MKDKKLTQIIAFSVIGVILAVILITVISNIVHKANQDWDGFAQDLTALLQKNDCEFISNNGEDIYKLWIDDDKWKSLKDPADFVSKLCDYVCTIAYNHKIIDAPHTPMIMLYNSSGKVAEWNGKGTFV